MTNTPATGEGPHQLGAPRPTVNRRSSSRRACTNAHACQLYGDDANEVDHISAADNHDPANLRSLCSPCHRRVTSARASLSPPPRTAASWTEASR